MSRTHQRYGWLKDHPDQRDFKWSATRTKLKAVPPRIDWRPGMPAVYDQQSVGCCTGEAVGGQLHYRQLADKISPVVPPSALFLYYNGRLQDGTQNYDDGSTIRDVIKGAAVYGFAGESCWKFDPTKTTKRPLAACYKDAASRKIQRYLRIPQSANQLRACLADGGVVSFGFTVYESFESDTVAHKGIVSLPGTREAPVGGHAVLLVGYDDTLMFPGYPSKGYFWVRNSWGPSWGMRGYFATPYDFVLNTDIASDFWRVFMTPGVV